ncbi:MAG: hypothetical protein KDI01_03855 [Halioglobus sp.]|nr:hypothetical protein [Halioglobus sp.]
MIVPCCDTLANLSKLPGPAMEVLKRSLKGEQLVEDGAVQLNLFDERNLFELSHPDFPGERLVACRNPELARRRAAKRQSLLEATAKELDTVCGMVERRRLQGRDKIGVRVGKVIDKYIRPQSQAAYPAAGIQPHDGS